MEKKYTIHILSVRAIDGETFDLPREQNAVIVCTDIENRFIFRCLPDNILIINFPDVENDKYRGAFDTSHARQIIDFIRNLSEKVTDLYICCSRGVSRSPAVAAAVLRMSGRNDRAVWCNPYYTPNTLVYYGLCREYGLFTPRFTVWLRTRLNRRSFRMAQKGIPQPYELWQIID